MPLTIYDEADFELLKAIHEAPRSRTDQLATILNVEPKEVASRLSWMRRFDLVERTLARTWILTPKGRDLIDGRADDLMAVRQLSKQARRSKTLAWVTKREFNRNIR